MNAKSTIKKIMFIAVWLCIGGGMVTLLLAAIGNRNKGVCSGYVIVMNTTPAPVFMQKSDVDALLTKLAGGKIRNREVSSFNLFDLEQKLEDNSWISDAELWFDNKEVLHVRVAEKQPVARIFTREGDSYYIDRNSRRIPLSINHTAKLPVFTGFPDGKKLSAKDSVLLSQVTEAAILIHDHPFWMAQVAQVDIAENRTMDMVPLVGTHIVRLGTGEDLKKKFHRLYLFYQQVLSKKGFGSYEVIDVQYKGQVVASKGDSKNKVDAGQYRKHIEKLIKESHDEIIPIPGRYDLLADSVINVTPELVDKEIKENKENKEKKEGSETRKTGSLKKKERSQEKEKRKEDDPKRTPKAVMPKKTEAATGENGDYDYN